jgi:hypothetical protein
MGVVIEICVKHPGRSTRMRVTDISGILSSSAPGVFFTYFYNHVHRLRLEKLLYVELSRSSNGYFKPRLDPGGGFASETDAAVSEVKRPLHGRFGSETFTNL